ncbi:MAG: hypothetical protein HKL90_06600 [Elusimicrobia bacterium]|nr:hypothetical protein [Elusimicrobiota bacterium]
MIAALLIFLGGLSGAPALADAAAALPALPAAAAPAGGIHERAGDLWRRIRTASASDPAAVGALQQEWNQLKAIQREFGSDPDTHVVMRQAKQALAMLNAGVMPPPVAGEPAAASGPHPTVSAPTAAQSLLNAAGGAVNLDGGALFDGSLASGGEDSPGADPSADLGPGKKAAKKKKKKDKSDAAADKPEKFHKHIWSTTYDDAALVILQKHADASASMDYLQRIAHGMAAKLRDRNMSVNWDDIKKFRFKVTNDHFVIRLKYKDHSRTSLDLGDAGMWLPGYKRKHRKDANKKNGSHAASLAGRRRSHGTAFASHGRGGARRQTPRRGAGTKAEKAARKDRAASDAAQLAAARAAGARALKAAKATALGLKGGAAEKPSAGVAVAAAATALAGRRGFYARGPGFDAETFSSIDGPAARRTVGSSTAVAARGADADPADESLRDAVAAGPSDGAAVAPALKAKPEDFSRAAALRASAPAPSAFGGLTTAAGLLLLLLALAALAVERGASRRA